MKKSNLLLFLILFVTPFAWSCFNETRVTIKGEKIEFDRPVGLPVGHDIESEAAKENLRYEKWLLDSLWKADKKIDDYSDYGVVLAYLGEYTQALQVFQKIEAIKPGLYATAANMGTTYELMGNKQLAYNWIKRALKINPKAHDSSEWLHLKILELRIKGDRFLSTQFLLDTDFGNDSIPKSKLGMEQLKSLRNAIYYQLNERVTFIKPKDKIVALLLFELGNINAITDDATAAYRIYEKAKEYGYESALFNKRFAFVKNLQKIIQPGAIVKQSNGGHISKKWKMILVSLGIGILILIGFYLRRRRR